MMHTILTSMYQHSGLHGFSFFLAIEVGLEAGEVIQSFKTIGDCSSRGPWFSS